VWSVHGDLLVTEMVSFELVVAGDDGDGHGGTVAAVGALRTTFGPRSEALRLGVPRHTAHTAQGVARTGGTMVHNALVQRHCSGSGLLYISLSLMDSSLERGVDFLAQALTLRGATLLVVGDDKPQRNAHPAA
jgi:hypothetical protein